MAAWWQLLMGLAAVQGVVQFVGVFGSCHFSVFPNDRLQQILAAAVEEVFNAARGRVALFE